jgi:nucleoside 2-deoxyribosyltransferase
MSTPRRVRMEWTNLTKAPSESLPCERPSAYGLSMANFSATEVLPKPIAYLAGPEVFLPHAVEIGRKKIAICRARGLDARFPRVRPGAGQPGSARRGHAIFKECVKMMEECNLIIANMTPFRGVSMDVGTAVEIGFMYARGHSVFGYTNVIDNYHDRVPEDSMRIESFGFTDNLMCEGPIWQSHTSVVSTRVDATERFTDLRGFVACVDQAAAMDRKKRRMMLRAQSIWIARTVSPS